MPENLPPPPNKPRGLVLIMIAMFGVLFLAIMMFSKGMGTQSKSWSELLQMIREGEVLEIQPSPESVHVKLAKNPVNGKSEEFTVLYPGARLDDTEKKQLQDAIEESKKRVVAE